MAKLTAEDRLEALRTAFGDATLLRLVREGAKVVAGRLTAAEKRLLGVRGVDA